MAVAIFRLRGLLTGGYFEEPTRPTFEIGQRRSRKTFSGLTGILSTS